MIGKRKRVQQFLSICGMIAPVLFIFTAILGGALRPSYRHISDTVSELFSPGSPNKPLLDILHTLFAILLVFYGFGILLFVRKSKQANRMGLIGAILFIVSGFVSVANASFFPQDAWGSPPTFPGEMHIILSGVIGLLSIFSMLLIGGWLYKSGLFPGFRLYSLTTVIFVIISAGFFAANLGSPIMGLAERITIFIGFQWTFVLALWMFSKNL